MKDFFGQELSIGDTVAFLPERYRELVSGTIVAFTNSKVRVEFINRYYGQNSLDKTIRYPLTVIKKPTPLDFIPIAS